MDLVWPVNDTMNKLLHLYKMDPACFSSSSLKFTIKVLQFFFLLIIFIKKKKKIWLVSPSAFQQKKPLGVLEDFESICDRCKMLWNTCYVNKKCSHCHGHSFMPPVSRPRGPCKLDWWNSWHRKSSPVPVQLLKSHIFQFQIRCWCTLWESRLIGSCWCAMLWETRGLPLFELVRWTSEQGCLLSVWAVLNGQVLNTYMGGFCADIRDRCVFSDGKHVDIHDRFTCSVCVKKSEADRKSGALSLKMG